MKIRERIVERNLMATLRACGDYLVLEDQLWDEVQVRTVPPPLLSEFDSARKNLESRRLIIGLPTEHGTKWKLTDEGRAWCLENL